VNIIPKKDQVLGRTVDVVRSEGGLELPATQNNATVLVLIDAVGPDVKGYEPGQLVAPHHLNHIYMRGGLHRVIFAADEILAVVEDVAHKQLSVDGAPPEEASAAE
jgi:hypothetical protein